MVGTRGRGRAGTGGALRGEEAGGQELVLVGEGVELSEEGEEGGAFCEICEEESGGCSI